MNQQLAIFLLGLFILELLTMVIFVLVLLNIQKYIYKYLQFSK